MQKFFFGLFLLSALFMGSFFAAKNWPLRSQTPPQLPLFIDAFRATDYPLQNRPFVIAIVGKNNGANVQKTLESAFAQSYDNYRLVYIDDASEDGSFDLANDLICSSKKMLRVDCVQNAECLGHLANIARVVKECSDEEIVVVLEGEDWLAHEWVLQRLNSYYANSDLWLTYGQSLDFPAFEQGSARPFKKEDVEESGFRGHPFVATHLKTFYALLFKKIKEADFVHQGKYLPASGDLAYMIPMLELAKGHFHYIPEVLYIHNREKNRAENPDAAARCEKFVRSQTPYEPLVALFSPPVSEEL